MIIGRFENGRPMVAGHVAIPRLGWHGSLWFLADTGADGTCVHPKDGVPLGLPFDLLGREVASRGVGGVARRFAESAIVSLSFIKDFPVPQKNIRFC